METMDDDVVYSSSMSHQDKAILMLIERIGHLEDELHKYKKDALIRDILTSDDRGTLFIDVFMYLLGIPPLDRSPNDMVKEIACKYKNGVSNRVYELSTLIKSDKLLWDMDGLDLCCYSYLDIGINICAVLERMTHDELEGLWEYKLRKTECLI
jgi:hypothetical protein